MLRPGRKVFCIGLNKSGTSSLHHLFEDLGLRAYHDDDWPHYTRVRWGWLYFRHRAYSDGERPDFMQLERWFPGSLFILNTRDERDWLQSRIKHVMRRGTPSDPRGVLEDQAYGIMAREFWTDAEAALRKWIQDRRIYEAQARTWFAGTDRFTEVDVTSEEAWAERLTAFLRSHGFALQGEPRPGGYHVNRRDPEELDDQERLKAYLALADRMLVEG